MMHVVSLVCRIVSSRSSTQVRSALGNRFGPGMTLAVDAPTTDGRENPATATSGSIPPRTERRSSAATPMRSRDGLRKTVNHAEGHSTRGRRQARERKPSQDGRMLKAVLDGKRPIAENQKEPVSLASAYSDWSASRPILKVWTAAGGAFSSRISCSSAAIFDRLPRPNMMTPSNVTTPPTAKAAACQPNRSAESMTAATSTTGRFSIRQSCRVSTARQPFIVICQQNVDPIQMTALEPLLEKTPRSD